MIEAPPFATWHRGLDLIAVERVVRGVLPLPELTEGEQRHAAVLMTTDMEMPARAIAARLGVSERTVTRWRTDAGVSDGSP
ncbi:helix-turn-helix domain-containing protein [Streptomyces milbemycinicus]|uniref:helix-turn-helix domain-containing protein n=1 Tax=Streptomyces milbemycinicus TaxID=476552 RepID=UPI000A3AFF25|nr:helix-turn-helix domain-containing protein [Streptomyces milbemycinicus]